jgi:hypothetical protein
MSLRTFVPRCRSESQFWTSVSFVRTIAVLRACNASDAGEHRRPGRTRVCYSKLGRATELMDSSQNNGADSRAGMCARQHLASRAQQARRASHEDNCAYMHNRTSACAAAHLPRRVLDDVDEGAEDRREEHEAADHDGNIEPQLGNCRRRDVAVANPVATRRGESARSREPQPNWFP